ncbi:MAG: RIP metalloprotease RseP [Alphaproteobacteria bacterium 64-11]|nr:RIP metalloprotease RseP [Alphaproteobacteria bacterium]OJU07481.1 MAG: RIP metalloprotease RseP [Alphaproteobacteria bacterium 64-11]
MHLLDAIRGLIAWTPLGLPAFLFVITVVVFFHELGHFLVARWFGVKVEVFSVGFGREIFGFTDRKGTRWKLSWIPVGGYVKFAGDADAASTPDREAVARMTPEERAQSLALKPVGQRAAVAAAGPFANFVLAIVLLTGLLLFSGHTVIQPLIGLVAKDSPAAAAGLKTGDLVTSIDGTKVTDFQQLPQIISISGGQTLAFGIRRGGHDMTVWVKPRLMTSHDFLGNVGEQVMIGVGPNRNAAISTERYGPAGAFAAACRETWTIARTTILGVAQIIGGHGSADQLRGPAGIAQMTGQVAAFGFLALLNLVAVLSVSIGLANLFPIPLLDGGHLLYYACEAVLGRPLGARAQDVGFRLGLVLVLGLMLLSTWNDLVRLNLF